MVLKSDQQRIRELLSQAIPMMCKNGLAFKTEFCIEALIGITLDNDDVFLVNIKETFQNEDDDEGGGKEGVVSSGTAAAISSPTKKRSKKRRSSSEANGSPTAADIKQEENEQELRQSHESDRESVSKRRRHGDGSNTGKSSDVVVIKDEPTSDNELEAALWMHDNDPPHGVYSEQMQNLMTGSFSGETSRTYADQQHLPGSSGDPNEQDFITYAAPESEGLSQFRPSPGRSKPPPTGASSAMAQINPLVVQPMDHDDTEGTHRPSTVTNSSGNILVGGYPEYQMTPETYEQLFLQIKTWSAEQQPVRFVIRLMRLMFSYQELSTQNATGRSKGRYGKLCSKKLDAIYRQTHMQYEEFNPDEPGSKVIDAINNVCKKARHARERQQKQDQGS